MVVPAVPYINARVLLLLPVDCFIFFYKDTKLDIPICILRVHWSLGSQRLLCCFYPLWPHPLSLPPTWLWEPRSFQRTSLLHWFLPLRCVIDWIPILPFSTVPHTIILMWPDPPPQPNTHRCSSKTGPDHASLVLGLNLGTISQEIWENKPYRALVFVCLAPIWKFFELLLIKDVQIVLEIFGVWNQDIARNSVTDKQNGMGTLLLGDRKKPLPTIPPFCIISHSISSGTFSDMEQSFATGPLTQHRWGGRDSLSCSDLGKFREEWRLSIGVPEQMSFHGSLRGGGFVFTPLLNWFPCSLWYLLESTEF